MFVHGNLSYFGKSPEFHVHLLNIDLFPRSLGPILYTGLTYRGEWKTFNDSQMKFTEEISRHTLKGHVTYGTEIIACQMLSHTTQACLPCVNGLSIELKHR